MNSCIILFLLLFCGNNSCGISNWNMCGSNCARNRDCDCDNNIVRRGCDCDDNTVRRGCDCDDNTVRRSCDCDNNTRRNSECDDVSVCFPNIGRSNNCGCDND